MADITVDSTAATTRDRHLFGPYWGDDQVAAIIGMNSSVEPTIYTTSNGGTSWTETALESLATAGAVAAYYDADVPGVTTKIVHMIYTDYGVDRISYRSYNLDTQTLSSRVTIVAANVASDGADECFVLKTRNANLLMGWRSNGGATSGVYRSVDSGANWTSRADVWETTTEDVCMGVTCNTGDDADAAVVFWDWSADEISIKVYDDSANTWTETSISTGMVEYTLIKNYSVATFRSNGKAFLAAFDDQDGTAPDLKTWLLDINSVSSPTVTAKTSVLTATNEAACPAVFIDPRTDEIYVCYLSGSAFTATVNPFYKKSSDIGGSWGSAVSLSDALDDDYRALSVGGTCFSNGGRVMPVWYDDDDNDYLTSVFADVVITSDTLVEANASGSSDAGAIGGQFWVSPSVGAIVYCNDSSDVVARKTTDGGATWGASTAAEAGTSAILGTWFDQQTVGNTGDLIHAVWVDSGASDFTYANYDISSGTWSTPVDINATLTISGSEQVAITRTRSGNLIAVLAGATAGNGAWKSTDVGASWSSISSPAEGTAADFVWGAYCDTDDDADAAILFWDVSGDEISVKVYDDSANTWGEKSVGTSMAEIGLPNLAWSSSTRLSDGHVILAAWNAYDSSTADLKVWDLNINTSTAASVSVTAKTDVLTNTSEGIGALVFIDQSNDDIYVAYCRGTAAAATTSAVYKKSTDDSSTWGSETSYSQQVEDDFRSFLPSAMGPASQGGRFQPVFFDDDEAEFFINLQNDIEIAAAGSSFDPATGFAPQQPFPSIPDWRRVPAIAY